MSEPGDSPTIVVVGLGYVGLPLAVALAGHCAKSLRGLLKAEHVSLILDET